MGETTVTKMIGAFLDIDFQFQKKKNFNSKSEIKHEKDNGY